MASEQQEEAMTGLATHDVPAPAGTRDPSAPVEFRNRGIAPPRQGINGQPFDYDYVHLP